jgi:hypothetical protein
MSEEPEDDVKEQASLEVVGRSERRSGPPPLPGDRRERSALRIEAERPSRMKASATALIDLAGLARRAIASIVQPPPPPPPLRSIVVYSPLRPGALTPAPPGPSGLRAALIGAACGALMAAAATVAVVRHVAVGERSAAAIAGPVARASDVPAHPLLAEARTGVPRTEVPRTEVPRTEVP